MESNANMILGLTDKRAATSAASSVFGTRWTLMALIVMGIGGIVADATATQCGGLHKLKVTDLDMSPDPVRQGQYIERFRVTLYADGNGECATKIRITDNDQVASEGTAHTLDRGGRQSPYRRKQGIECGMATIASWWNWTFRRARRWSMLRANLRQDATGCLVTEGAR